MWKSIFKLNNATVLIWCNAVFLLTLVSTGFIPAVTVVFGYFLETIIIGLIHAFKLHLVIKYGEKSQPSSKNSMPSGYGAILFFLFHYGFFVAIQSIFAFSFFEAEFGGMGNPFNLISNYNKLLRLDGMEYILVSIALTNLWYFYTNFYATEKYREYSVSSIFFKPYLRIFIQQFVVILSGFFFIMFSGGIAAAILLIVFRLVIDLFIVSVKKNSAVLEMASEKLSKKPEEIAEIKRRLQEFTE